MSRCSIQDSASRLTLNLFPQSVWSVMPKVKKFYQYTAIDEYSRWRYVEAFEEHSTYSSSVFVEHLIRHFPMPIECVQTDNGAEFTKRFTQPEKENSNDVSTHTQKQRHLP